MDLLDRATHPEAAQELEALRAFDRGRLLEAIAEHLRDAPLRIGGRKKRLDLGDGDFIRQAAGG